MGRRLAQHRARTVEGDDPERFQSERPEGHPDLQAGRGRDYFAADSRPLDYNRGTKELLFIAAGQTVYAIDGDLGRLFRKRDVGAPVDCLALAAADTTLDDDDDDDKPQALRPLYARLTGGKLRALHPTRGGDIPLGQAASCRPASYREVKANGLTFRASTLERRAGAPVSTGLAIANGHICFATADNRVQCLGFAIDR